MTIKEIGYTEERINEKEMKKEDDEEQKRHKKLIKEFNKKAEELKSYYRIGIKYAHPHLNKIVNRKLFFWNYKEVEEITQVVYISIGDYFVFNDGLNFKIFKEIERILNSISIKFKVKLKSGKIPVKYKILEELGK